MVFKAKEAIEERKAEFASRFLVPEWSTNDKPRSRADQAQINKMNAKQAVENPTPKQKAAQDAGPAAFLKKKDKMTEDSLNELSDRLKKRYVARAKDDINYHERMAKNARFWDSDKNPITGAKTSQSDRDEAFQTQRKHLGKIRKRENQIAKINRNIGKK